MVAVGVTPGTAEANSGTESARLPDEAVTRRSALMALSTLAVADFDTEAPNTAMAETRAMPIISAEAVWAVRRGLRIELSRPSLPASPNAPASGRPMAEDNGRATAGASMATPKRRQQGSHGYKQHVRFGQPDGQHDATHNADRAAPDELASGRDLSLGLTIDRARPPGVCARPAGPGRPRQ